MSKIKPLVLSLRPKHWVKNIFILAAPFFSLQLFNPGNFSNLIAGLLCWCAITSAVYLFNDIIDKKEDLLHPDKKNRPIASGLINTSLALSIFILLALAAIMFSTRVNAKFTLLIVLYLLINLVYSLYLKHIFILDVISIAMGFVLRVVSGAALVNVGVSGWIIMCAFLVSLLLGFGKRREELAMLKEEAVSHRKALKDYAQGFLERAPYCLAVATIICYMFYTVSGEAIRKFGNRNLIYTTPFVIYGLVRYVYIAYKKNKGADPTQVVFSDLSTVINILLWVTVTGLIIYKF
ncbi:MAG: decaprenyl-phosphate phosphoribosyltransferase [Candidatus Omnitrophota bacterium]|nr:decaprenyl-phosphate phosphoribosyltransferase [Candidatus Omnitrophota bacterium]